MRDPEAMRHRYICVDGPIAVGKSTLSRKLAEHFSARLVLEEFDDNPFLRHFYNDPKLVAFQTQVYFLLARFKQQETLRQQDLFSRTLVSDYLFAKDRIFAYMNLSREELALYERIYDLVQPQILKPDLVLYLHAEPQVLMERLAKRGRTYESSVESIYLEELMSGYNRFFAHYSESPLLILDTSRVNFENNPDDFHQILELIAQTTEGQHRHVLNSRAA